MSASVRFTGLEEFKAALSRLPQELSGEGQAIVYGAADEAAAEIIAKYPARTGNLRKGVKVTRSASAFATTAVVKNTAPHAFIFENGTEARHYFTDPGGVRKEVGKMPPGHVFVPIVIRKRREMYEQLKALLVKAGLSVSGEAA